MPFLRLSAACLAALACLGAGYADARLKPPGKAVKPGGARLSVEICAGEARPGLCGPKAFSRRQLGGGFPEIARQAGVVSAPALNIKCPGKCGENAPRPKSVTVRAWATVGGYYTFDHWEGACTGTVPTCRLRVGGDMTAKAVFRSDT